MSLLRQTAATATVLVALMTARVLRSRVIHTDDTPVRVIVPGQSQTREGRFWVYGGDAFHPFSVYDFTMNHTRDGPTQFLSGYEGYLQADGYGGYGGIAIRSDGKLILASCGAHIRRRFLPHLKAACQEAPLTDQQRLQLPLCRRPTQYLDLLRCYPRVLANQFLHDQVEEDLVEALSALLPDRWITEQPKHRLEINRRTGIPVGMESVLGRPGE